MIYYLSEIICRQAFSVRKELIRMMATTKLPQGRAERALELLRAALALTDDLSKKRASRAAVALGAKGGAKTAERGPEYFAEIAARRKTFAGGRPKKTVDKR
jgi:hypothetical protein